MKISLNEVNAVSMRMLRSSQNKISKQNKHPIERMKQTKQAYEHKVRSIQHNLSNGQTQHDFRYFIQWLLKFIKQLAMHSFKLIKQQDNITNVRVAQDLCKHNYWAYDCKHHDSNNKETN